MAKIRRHVSTKQAHPKRSHDRSAAQKLLKDFERQYIARNQDPHIYL